MSVMSLNNNLLDNDRQKLIVFVLMDKKAKIEQIEAPKEIAVALVKGLNVFLLPSFLRIMGMSFTL